MSARSRRAAPLLLATLLLAACDSGQDDAAAKKKAEEAEKAAKEKEALAKRKAEREAEEKRKADEAAAQQAKIDALAVIPDGLPKTLDKACEAMLKAYDEYMQKVLEGDGLTKWKTGGNEMQLAVFRKECLKRDIPTAMCQAHALGAAPPDMKPQLADIMKACADKAAAAQTPQ